MICQLGLSDLYLLTTTAADYFPRLGFQPVPRAAAPAALHASAKFQGACPASATLMHRSLTPHPENPMTRISPERTTHAFLHAAPDLPLELRLGGQLLVPPGDHVTEVKAVTIRSMDCGGQANTWDETVVQLMYGTPDTNCG